MILSLASIMQLSWLPQVKGGCYFRAETFDTFANYIDELAKDPFYRMPGHILLMAANRLTNSRMDKDF